MSDESSPLPFLNENNQLIYHGLKSVQLSAEDGKDRCINLFQLMQRGLIYPSPFARFATFWQSDRKITRDFIADVVTETRKVIHDKFGDKNTTVIFGLSFDLFKSWCEADGVPEPKGMKYKFPQQDEDRETSTVFADSSGVFFDSAASIWVHIKSDEKSHLAGCYGVVRDLLGKYVTKQEDYQDCDSRHTRDSTAGKVLGCRFSENLNNPADPITIANHTLVGFDDVEHAGASYVLAQRFEINWEQLHNMSEEQIEDIIGRTSDDILIPTRDTRSHIRSARIRDEDGNTNFVMRLGLPFGRSEYKSKDLAYKGSNIRDEKGIYFAGFARQVGILESIMHQQIGNSPGFINDRLLNHVRSNLGGFFYIPSRADLGLSIEEWTGRAERKWDQFPGVKWARLSRHFQDKSENGRMYYNHKNYLYEMATMDKLKAAEYSPPSNRILALLLDAFTRWQDTWYFAKGQPEMGHLCEHIERDFGAGKVREVMATSIMERKAWAIRMTCRLYASDDYGYRGERPLDGVMQEGADTYRIHPLELIVGSMPDLTLAQGRYAMKYFREEEEISQFFQGLSEASGVGHIVPDFQKLVREGIGGLLSEVDRRLGETSDESKKSFYRANIISLQGVQDHLAAYAELAKRRAEQMAEGQTAEKDNLENIARRLNRLQSDKPGTMLEAVQLIFTMYTCLQLNGEPVSIGRLDQYLISFYVADLAANRITEDEAQEIIDAFWVKIDEKVLQNRMFIQDHQPFGNLAMGGSSGPYPQGASLGQWIHQVTVGGVSANDDAEPTLAYNTVTELCLRAAARLPLNAPCLSLRVSRDTPEEFLEEAAKAILSGGAHPILMNDDKIIPGLQASGDCIGDGGENDNEHTPVADKAGRKWNSTVSLASARNYACDGCYEPMFVGENWFTLGGFSTLDPLECALNQGRLYASAGPVYLLGQNHSFRSKSPVEIKTFNELVDLYFQHFYQLCAKALDGQLSTFDALVGSCPSPLLSTLIYDCLEKGLDLYGGGARYNVYGPCFIGLSSTINSLYNINKMVFQPDTAVTSLPELVECLMCDWGDKMVEPFVSSLVGPVRTEARAERFRRLREIALSYEKFGRGQTAPGKGHPYDPNDRGTYEIDQLGNYIVERIADLTVKVFRDPHASTAEKMLGYAEKYGTVDHPFGGFQIQPGVGTFENFVAFGGSSGASADGRRLGESIASDLSPSPSPMDRAPDPQTASFSRALGSYMGSGTDKIWDGAPTEFNIAEDFPLEDLVRVLREFADGQGSNVLTVTCASPKTFADAPGRPEKYDLLRVRMGGWTEFFTSMFPGSQLQHQRRPISTHSELP
ncbi:MAG: Dyp-type peroxidase [Chloroflexi bacterium]|nr:Dyp-type peroxidase [Chloroflexota bacterium]